MGTAVMKNGDIQKQSAGLTLVEILVGLALLAFVALSLIAMLTTSIHLSKLAQERSVATALASDRIQQITSLPYQVPANYLRYQRSEETALAGPPITFTTDYGSIPEYPDYRRVVQIEYDTPVAGMMSVETTISWQHVGQIERSHVMVTFLHPGLE